MSILSINIVKFILLNNIVGIFLKTAQGRLAVGSRS